MRAFHFALLSLAGACNAEPQFFRFTFDGSDAPDGGTGADGDGGTSTDGVPLPDGFKCGNTEVCNGIDDDCNNAVDDDVPGVGDVCGTDVGECQSGIQRCTDGVTVCEGGIASAVEACDGLDNNCDGDIDEVYDILNDPAHCGGCDPCDLDNATPLCNLGTCEIADCDDGFVDFNLDHTDGCEYECTPTPDPAEICDGLDNDCDTLTDDEDDDFVELAINPCVEVGGCSGATVTCEGDDGWTCNYPGASCPSCPEVCDGQDNDCDMAIDETFNVGDSCADDGVGICQGTGEFVCTVDETATECDINEPGGTPGSEACNGLDDDCDGSTDEASDADDDLTLIDFVATPFYIYTYEATRPDANDSGAGLLEARACSKADAYPWADVDLDTAQEACEAAGKHLCTRDEWGAACEGTGDDVYPYGDTYSASDCNGNDYDAVPGGGDDDAVFLTGSFADCVSSDGAFDLSGNLKEWTDDPISDGSAPDPDGYTVRGGAYDNTSGGLTCDFDVTVLPVSYTFSNLGFRCCCVPGVDAVCPDP